MGLDMTINRLPAPTWNWLHVNEASLAGVNAPGEGWMEAETPETIEHHTLKAGCNAEYGISENEIAPAEDTAGAAESALIDAAVKLAQISGGVGPDMKELQKQGNSDFHIWEIAPGVKESEPVRLHFRYETGAAMQNMIGVHAQENSEITVIMDFRSVKPGEESAAADEAAGGNNVKKSEKELNAGAGCGSLAAVQTKILAEKGAKVTLIQIQHLEDGFTFLNDVGVSCAEDAKMESIQLVLGGGDTYMGLRTNLGAKSAALDGKIGYLLDREEKLDMNYLAYQTGAKTASHMDVSGVLRGASQKLFRGTIDFRKGSEGAKGDEKEDVLLFSDGVVNRTVPLILCEEEDVEGNHGATIGRLDDSLMFYLSSRGIEEKDIYEMMARARIDAICSGIADEQTRELVKEFIS